MTMPLPSFRFLHLRPPASAILLMHVFCCLLLFFQSIHAFSPPQQRFVSRRAPLVKTRHLAAASSRRTSLIDHSRLIYTAPTNPSVSLFATSKIKNNDENNTDESTSSSLTSEIAPQLESIKVGGLLLPLAKVLEDVTGGWALTYADLSPETETTPVGLGFLATNMAYTICGLLLVQSGNVLLGVLTELASVASFAYHFTQLKLGKNQPLVRVALLVDYVVAAATLLAALVYIIQVGIFNVPWQGIVASVLAVLFLFLSWVWEEGLPYVINHGLWHLLGAYAGLIIGQAQYSNGMNSWWQ